MYDDELCNFSLYIDFFSWKSEKNAKTKDIILVSIYYMWSTLL